MNIMSVLSVSLGAALAENLVFSGLFGVSPFLKNSEKTSSAFRTGIAVAITVFFAAILSSILDWAIINPLKLGYMKNLIFVLVAVGGVSAFENIMGSKSPKLYKRLGISLSAVVFSAAVLAVMLIVENRNYNILQATLFGAFSGIGYIAAILLFAEVRARLEYSVCPEFLKGMPIAFITAGLIALAFSGFTGMKFM